MNELTREGVYTTKEVAEILGVNRSTVTKWIKAYFPNKMQNGKVTYLNQAEITIIKQKMNINPNLRCPSEVITDLEIKNIKTNKEKNINLNDVVLFYSFDNVGRTKIIADFVLYPV